MNRVLSMATIFFILALYSGLSMAAGVKISAMPAASALAGTELVPIVQGGVTKQTAASSLFTYIKTVDGSGSGLDADTLDGLNSSYFQPASTAITTSNIGSQTVNSAAYATNAGTATTLNGLRMLGGTVTTAGTTSATTGGFTVTKLGSGSYRVTWDVNFVSNPIITATTFNQRGFVTYSLGSGTATFVTSGDDVGSTDYPFSFIAIGY